MFVETYVEQEAAVAAFIQSAVEHFGQLNILVNNAGIRMYQTVVEASAESWNTILGVNLMGMSSVPKPPFQQCARSVGGALSTLPRSVPS